MGPEAKAGKRRKPSRGALVGFTIAAVTVGWLVYSFVGELAPPPATRRVDDLEVSLYSTLTGRPRVGDNQFEIKIRDRQARLVSQAEVDVDYGMVGMAQGSRLATRPEGYGIFSTVLSFPMPGSWDVEVTVRRPGGPEVRAPFSVQVR
jgi:hypothetical protein